MDYDDVIERAARAMCSADPEVRMGDAEGVVQQRVALEWPHYAEAARAAAPILMQYGARLMRDAAAETASELTKEKERGHDYGECASSRIRTLDPAAIVKEAVK